MVDWKKRKATNQRIIFAVCERRIKRQDKFSFIRNSVKIKAKGMILRIKNGSILERDFFDKKKLRTTFNETSTAEV
jgi:hypothetical protein